LQASHDFFTKLIQDQDPRLEDWQKKGIEINQIIKNLLEEFCSSPPAITPETFKKVYAQHEKYLLHDIVIPLRIMACINHELEAEGELSQNFKKARELYEPFRAGSQYPTVLREVFPYFYKTASQKTGIPEELCSLMIPKELLAAIEGELLVSKEELANRQQACSFWENPETGEIEFSYDKNILEKLGLKEDIEDLMEFSGKIAFAGQATGIVKVVNNDKELDKVNEGDIIVSFNTNPSLMSALKKCAAIITNEGGIMCHAAIISRELQKPCIIGTKIATKVLKDGDLVEVDANTGVVRKI
jgi:phosphohistidine swiveling domain-containing protein